MHAFGVILELLGAFLLAAEAIKVENLARLGRAMKDVAGRMREFNTADRFTFNMTGSLIGLAVLLLIILLNVELPVQTVVVIHLAASLSLVIFLLLLETIARGLAWIERNTASGVVGIVGFLLLAAGILIREAV